MIRTKQTVAALMIGASSIALASPALATETVFSTSPIDVREGARINQQQGVTQIRLNNGATASFVDLADFRIDADGSIDLYAGAVTVTAGTDGSETLVRMPEGVEGRVAGAGSAASFSVGPEGDARGHALSGQVRIGRAENLRAFDGGEMFAIARGGSVRQVVSNGIQSTPGMGDGGADVEAASAPVLAMGGDAGPVAAAQNGLPVSLGDALAAAGASGDILSAAQRVEAAAANPSIETFPSGDLQLLVAAAANLEDAFGGTPFPAAQAEIIRTYLGFLAGGGSGADFLTAYSGFLAQYFDLIRGGGTPRSFALANIADIDAFTRYLARTRGFAALSAQDRALADAYLAFIAKGGNADLFAGTFTDLTKAYFAFLRAGGTPQDFTAANLATVESYLAFLDASGLDRQLSATDRALLDAYLANGGVAFLPRYRAALDAYFAFLASGQRPSAYKGADIGVLLGYVQTLQAAGLLDATLGKNAKFFADYAAFVQGGGKIDAFGQLNANVFAGYADALNAYFAFLDAGGVPSAYTAADAKVLNGYLAQLAASGALDRFLGERSAFFADYLAFLQGGGAIDTYAALNANIFGGYAKALAAYYAYLENGGIPSAYTALDQDTIRAYLAALARVGATDGFLADLAAFYSEYFAFVTGGGNPDNFAGLPVPPDFPAFASALNAYAAFLAGGGLPSAYDAVDFDLLQNYLEAIVASGQLADLLGTNADLLTGYFAYLGTGGTLDGFSGLPVYAGYVSALNAYYAYLQAGGLPADYAALDQATIQSYLAALDAAGGFAAYGSLDAFFVDYFAFVAAGNDPAAFARIPVYADYVAALNAYYAYLAEGGTPSAYTVLTQAQVEAYLAALARTVGGFANFAKLDAFFVSYFAYLDQGGDPDKFAGLPGGGSRIPFGNAVLYAFDTDSGQRNATGAKASVEESGKITSVTVSEGAGSRTFDYTSNAFVFEEAGRVGNVAAWTRYSRSANAAENGQVHLLVGAPAVDLPATGVVGYDLIGGTAPTDLFSAPGSVGYFTGELGVAFGAAPKVGMNFDVTFGKDSWRSQTTGGAANPALGGLAIGAKGDFAGLIARTGLNGTACAGSCQTNVTGNLFGAQGAVAGLRYFFSEGGTTGAYASGVAVFGREGTKLDGLGNPDQAPATGGGDNGGGGTPKPVFLAGDGNARVGSAGDQVAFITANASSAVGVATPIKTTDGALLQADLNLEKIDIQPTASSEYQRGGSDGILGWSRINNFGGSVTNGNRQSFVLTPFASRYAHSIWGAPSVNLPTSGLVNYDLVGWTTPTATNARDLTGSSFDGRLAIDFATLKLGLEATVDVVTDSYKLSSAGGIATPSLAITTDPSAGRGNIFTGNLTVVDSAGKPVSRGAYVSGFLAGSGASHVGLTYGIRTASSNTIEGTAAFRASTFQSGPGSGGGTGGDTGSGGETPGGAIVGLQPSTDYTDRFVLAKSGLVAFDYSTANPGRTKSLDQSIQSPSTLGFATDAKGAIAEVFLNGRRGWYDKLLPALSTSAAIAESGTSASKAVDWARWTNGVVSNNRFGNPPDFGMTAKQGYHVISGTPATDIPTSGTLDYDLAGGTSPTSLTGKNAPGSLVSGSARIAFGTQARIGISLQFDYAADRFTAATDGGIAAAATSGLAITSAAFSGAGVLTSTGASCASTTCSIDWSGFLAGPGASDIGTTFEAKIASDTVLGAAAFARKSSAASAAFSPSASASAMAMPTATQDWGRWTGSGEAVSAVAPGTEIDAAGSADALATMPDPRAALGGWITFPEVR